VSLAKDDPAQVWAALAPLLAGQPRVRLARNGGQDYPFKSERALTQALPGVPAAVRIFGKDGTCRAIFLDFDSSTGGESLVRSDVAAVRRWLKTVGARAIEDYSPNGGRHLYIPLAEPVSFHEARELVEALGNRLRSLDKTPHQNLLHGCMRVPGSRHKTGGHQQLAISLSEAFDIARRPNSPQVWRAMVEDLAAEIAAVKAFRLEQAYTPDVEDPDTVEAGAPTGRMSRTMQVIATTGLYDAGRYATDSEARQAVIAGAVAAGLTLTTVDRYMKQNVWPGLASFYARYRSTNRSKALQRDWAKAVSFLRERRHNGLTKNNDHKNPTSEPQTQPGVVQGQVLPMSSSADEHRFIRTWRNAASLTESKYLDSRSGQARRFVLRALGEAAHKTGSRRIEFGDRSLAVATGFDHTTVGSHLRALRSETDPLVRLLEAGRGIKGDLYELRIPEAVRTSAEEAPWKKGKIHALRPVFRELGMPAAFVYEALEHSPTALTAAELTRITRLSRTSVAEALEVLAAWNLASRGQDGWSLVPGTSLRLLAEHFGVLEAVAAQFRKYKEERIRWREWLSSRAVPQLLPSPDDDYPWESFVDAYDDDFTLPDLVFRDSA
jgi:hypothetical protein